MFRKNKKRADEQPAEQERTGEQQAGQGPAGKEQTRKWRFGRKPRDTQQTRKKEPRDERGARKRSGRKQVGEPDRASPEEAGRLLDNLSRTQAGQRRYTPDAPLGTHLLLLRAWQSQRLMRTHADLAVDPRYVLACRFFLEDIYSTPRDFSRQGEDVQRVYQLMLKFLPGRIIRPIVQSLELYNLSEDLDHALVDVLVNRLEMTDRLTPQLYAQAYRLCDNYALRVRQIELVGEVVRTMDGLVQLPFVPTTMRLARLPASRTGLAELYAFVERGVAALKEMGGADTFVSVVEQRELQILDRIFAGDPDPFDFDPQHML